MGILGVSDYFLEILHAKFCIFLLKYWFQNIAKEMDVLMVEVFNITDNSY